MDLLKELRFRLGSARHAHELHDKIARLRCEVKQRRVVNAVGSAGRKPPKDTQLYDSENPAYYVGPNVDVPHIGKVPHGWPGVVRTYGEIVKFAPSKEYETEVGTEDADDFVVDPDDIEPGYDL